MRPRRSECDYKADSGDGSIVRDKTIACLCEDVTKEEIQRAVMQGYRDIESLKRYVGFGTGPCKGKQCIQFVREILIEMGLRPEVGMTARPPIEPVPLAIMAQEETDNEEQL